MYCLFSVNLKRSTVPAGEVLKFQIITSVEVIRVPIEPTSVNVPFPESIPTI